MEIKKSTVYKRLFVANILVAIFLIATLDFYFVKKFYKTIEILNLILMKKLFMMLMMK